MSPRILLVPMLTYVLACGGALDGSLTDGGGDEGDANPPASGCPSSQPLAGSACGTESIECEYGSDPRWTCNIVTTCQNGAWSSSQAKDGTCPTTSSEGCPASMNDIDVGSKCSPLGLLCNYTSSTSTSFCTCNQLGGPIFVDGGANWSCNVPSMTGCPAVRPRIGTSCAQAGMECDYSICGLPSGLGVVCDPSTSTWAEHMSGLCAGAN